MKTLSVVIPVYGRWEAKRVLDAILPLDPLEVLVCDSSPQPNPVPEHPIVRLLHLEQRAFPGAARNAGWESARGEYILFVDADVVLTEEGRQFVARHVASKPTDMAFGLYATDGEGYNSTSRFVTTMQQQRFKDEFAKHRYRYGQSSHVVIRRDLAKEVGYFNPHLRIHEDKEICIRAVHAGVEVNVYPEFLAHHIKIFKLVSLMKDHAQKGYHAIKVELDAPQIFNKVKNQLNGTHKVSWILSFLTPFVVTALTALGMLSWPAALGVLAITFLSPLVLCREVFSRASPREKVTGLFLWPFMGAAVTTGAILAHVVGCAKTLTRKVLYLGVLARFAKRALIRNGMPLSIIHFVTSRCNLRCEHCFYKETLDAKDPGEQSLRQFEKTTREMGAILWYALGGGEPFIRKDLPDIHRIIMENCKPMMITIPTNGWYTEKVFQRTLQILQQMKRGTLTIQISVDGPKEIHDRIRGEGSWDRLIKTAEKLRQLRTIYPRLSLGIITVVSGTNHHAYPRFVDELVETFQPNQISINLIRNTTIGGPMVPVHVLDAYKDAIERYEWHMQQETLQRFSYIGGNIVRAKEAVQKELIYRVARFDEFVTPCTGGSLTYVIWEDGRVNACEVLPESVGNTLGSAPNNDFRNIVRSDKARALRQKIVQQKCRCSYECAMTINTLFSWPLAARMWTRALTGSATKPIAMPASKEA